MQNQAYVHPLKSAVQELRGFVMARVTDDDEYWFNLLCNVSSSLVAVEWYLNK